MYASFGHSRTTMAMDIPNTTCTIAYIPDYNIDHYDRYMYWPCNKIILCIRLAFLALININNVLSSYSLEGC
ncbi:hypothetical protein BDQ12DRAFT_675968 [Crucibulum laeve]|uniref:Uncharacterized protein n=1 Tax=Crucibulum laeve TaxID=68775 RepID=A0A5C3MMC4_9AGAR|nr:hypothetical protein BDQ12DRAFT_675968 [Crucibulum laeve]